MTRPDHLFVSSTDGALHDTRNADWSRHPLRPNYQRTHQRIKTLADLKATLRNGQYAWPGGYQMYFVTEDGDAMSFEAARENFSLIAREWNDKNGWRVVGCEINYEDEELFCAVTDKRIPSAYGDD